jgi:hypothetical protein
MAPPSLVAVLQVKVQLSIVNDPSLLIAPPFSVFPLMSVRFSIVTATPGWMLNMLPCPWALIMVLV